MKFPKTIPHFAIKMNLGTVPLNQKSVMAPSLNEEASAAFCCFWLPECLGQNSRLADFNWNRKSQIQVERLRSG